MQNLPLILTLCFCFGAVIGSFLSVCIFRIPLGRYEPVREGIPTSETPVSISEPKRSFCPHCKNQLLWWHNIPIVSWILLKGRCSFCKTKISSRYIFLEIFTGIISVLCFLRFGYTPTTLAIFLVLATMTVITFIDIDYMIIPNVISYPGTILGILVGAYNQFLGELLKLSLNAPFVPNIYESCLGLLAGAGVLFSIWWIYLKVRKREGLGLGDVKLLAMIGTMFGWECAWFTIFVGSLLGSVIGIATALFGRRGFSNYLPFGPYLVAALMLYVFDFYGVYRFFTEGEVPTQWWITTTR